MKSLFLYLSLFVILSCNDSKVDENIGDSHLDTAFLRGFSNNYDSTYTLTLSSGTAEHFVYNKDFINIIYRDTSNDIIALISRYKGKNIFAEEYFKNGQSKGKIKYASPGVISGKVKYYFKNGKIREIGEYTNGKETSKWKHFGEEGNVIWEEEHF